MFLTQVYCVARHRRRALRHVDLETAVEEQLDRTDASTIAEAKLGCCKVIGDTYFQIFQEVDACKDIERVAPTVSKTAPESVLIVHQAGKVGLEDREASRLDEGRRLKGERRVVWEAVFVACHQVERAHILEVESLALGTQQVLG